MLQSKLSHHHLENTSFKYTFITFPLWSIYFFLIGFYFLKKEKMLRKERLIFPGIVAFLVFPYLSWTLLGIYYDDIPNHGGMNLLGYTLIPLFIFEMIAVLGFFMAIRSTMILWKEIYYKQQVVYRDGKCCGNYLFCCAFS